MIRREIPPFDLTKGLDQRCLEFEQNKTEPERIEFYQTAQGTSIVLMLGTDPNGRRRGAAIEMSAAGIETLLQDLTAAYEKLVSATAANRVAH